MPNLRSWPSPGIDRTRLCASWKNGSLDAKVRVEREREHDRVRRHVAAGVIADEQHRVRSPGCCRALGPLRGTTGSRASHSQRQVLADVVRVALVEVGAGDPALRLVGDLAAAARPTSDAPRGGRASARVSGSGSVTRAVLLGVPAMPALQASFQGARQAASAPAARAAQQVPAPRCVGPSEEVDQQLARFLRALDLRHMAAGLDRHLLGAGQPLADVATEARPARAASCVPQMNSAGGWRSASRG